MNAHSEQLELFARCASGFEAVLASELRKLGAQRVRPLKGGVAFFGAQEDAYRACLWSRVATRIQLVFARIDAADATALYNGVRAFPWEQQVSPDATIAVRAHGQNKNLRNTQYIALKVKDALCDRLRDVRGVRPNVNAKEPDFAIDVSLHANRATLYANLSGRSLHERGYREHGVQVEAPLKETLAAGMVLASGWDNAVGHLEELLDSNQDSRTSNPRDNNASGRKDNPPICFIDPMCGSGTLAIEAALIAADIAPGILRTKWGFKGWALHRTELWEQLLQEAHERKQAGVERMTQAMRVLASDNDSRAIELARANAQRAGVADILVCQECDAACLLEESSLGTLSPIGPWGLLASNPPYGQRLLDADSLPVVYASLHSVVEHLPSSWNLAFITPDASIDMALHDAPSRVLACYNGPTEVAVRMYENRADRVPVQLVSVGGVERTVAVLEPHSNQFAARLRKMAKERAKWARREGITCYRIYDADLPDYSLAVDLYQPSATQPFNNLHTDGERKNQRESLKCSSGAFVRVAEYQAPAEIDPARADRRFSDALAIASAVLDVPAEHIYSKVRKRAKGGSQYQEARSASHVAFVEEGGYIFEVDASGYLDTGLFLDHRITRALVGSMAAGKRFLNLFAYTGTASVYAAGAPAAETTTVDLSQTYLAWARRNMEANGFMGKNHQFVRADVASWLEDTFKSGQRFDLVFCDPPTFSNSKAMEGRTFDVQRDHVRLLRGVAAVLADDGTILFSCNLRTFKLDYSALSAEGLSVEDITDSTIPHDFKRNSKIHRCYLLKKL